VSSDWVAMPGQGTQRPAQSPGTKSPHRARMGCGVGAITVRQPLFVGIDVSKARLDVALFPASAVDARAVQKKLTGSGPPSISSIRLPRPRFSPDIASENRLYSCPGVPDAEIAKTDSAFSEACADRGYRRAHPLLRRPGLGRRALRLAAIVFLRLLTRPPLRPFCMLARFLASLRTRPPNRPSATACGFFRCRFFTGGLHTSASSRHKTWCLSYLTMLIA
jgi:hypothetical protein